MKIRDIMTTKVVTARPDETIKEVILRLRTNKISGLPVVNSSNKIVGVFSESDVMMALPDILNDADAIPLIDIKELTDNSVRMVMSEPRYTVSPDADVKEAARIMLEKYVHRLPVIENEELIGLVSLGDVLKALSR
ncbi:CBS domain-containing protein [Geovibrio thiophilus]|uniref:CBS domain-containing protein n=1 Tax=Geovibrio thiophilus TaxID=139438 RepID=A0A410JYM7_9BACT|nr:CBS domain-containing protein [Geovibrio thiophilus]QAR33148.1 CBS domain-containing protein [Geovibrio thiophilus]